MADELSSKLQQYRKAIEQEYETAEAAIEKGDAESLHEAARKILAVNFTNYLQELSNIAMYGEGEGARLSALKYALSILFEEKAGKDESIEALLRELSGSKNEQ